MKPSQTTAADVQIESAALSRITWYSTIQIAGVASGIVTYILFLPGFFSKFPNTSNGTTSASDVASYLQGLLPSLSVVIVVMFAIGLIAVLLLLSAFRRLSRLDSPSFSMPATLTILLLVGVVIAGIGLIPLFWMLSSLLSNIVQNPTTHTFAGGQVADLSAAVALILIAGILTIIGVIGGEILGLWRVGTRYDSTLIKISAIFIVIPYLNWVGPVLLLVGALEAKNKLGRQAHAQFSGSP
jgi:MFS family permease